MFSSEEIAVHLNQARVGLILSEFEGANYASIQYLLCGLPVVTTRNRGGRDVFFDPQYVIWADDNPQSVADAVDELIGRNLNPALIRNATLAKIKHHRDMFMGLVSDIISGEGGKNYMQPDWDGFFCNKMLKRHSLQGVRVVKLYSNTKRLAASARLGP